MLTELDLKRNSDAITELEGRIALLEDAFNRLFEDHYELTKRMAELERLAYALEMKVHSEHRGI